VWDSFAASANLGQPNLFIDGVSVSEEIYSKPRYSRLLADLSGSAHLLVAEGEGGEALVELLDGAPDSFGASAKVLFSASELAHARIAESLTEASPGSLRICSSLPELMLAFQEQLQSAVMGTRIYAAGGAGFLGAVTSALYDFGLSGSAIQMEQRGMQGRPVQCVHCKKISYGITANLVNCQGCDMVLFVRDHYSKRLGAFMGVAANAEVCNIPLSSTEKFR
jgi:hypothetical protein